MLNGQSTTAVKDTGYGQVIVSANLFIMICCMVYLFKNCWPLVHHKFVYTVHEIKSLTYIIVWFPKMFELMQEIFKLHHVFSPYFLPRQRVKLIQHGSQFSDLYGHLKLSN